MFGEKLSREERPGRFLLSLSLKWNKCNRFQGQIYGFHSPLDISAADIMVQWCKAFCAKRRIQLEIECFEYGRYKSSITALSTAQADGSILISQGFSVFYTPLG